MSYTVSAEAQAFYDALPEPEVLINVPGESRPMKVKKKLFETNDEIFYYDPENPRFGFIQYDRKLKGHPPLTQKEIADHLLKTNPTLMEKLLDCGNPTDGPFCLPKVVDSIVRLVLNDGNTSHASMNKMRGHEKRAEVCEYTIYNPAIDPLEEELLSAKHCGFRVKEWPKWAQAEKMKRFLDLGMSQEAAQNLLGMTKLQYERLQLTHHLHTQFLTKYPTNENTVDIHTKISRFVDAGPAIADNQDYQEVFFTALLLDQVGDTNWVNGARLKMIFNNRIAREKFVQPGEKGGFFPAMETLGFIFNGRKFVKPEKKEKGTIAYLAWLKKGAIIVNSFIDDDYIALKRGEHALYQENTFATKVMNDILVKISNMDILEGLVTSNEKKRKTIKKTKNASA